MFNAYVSSYQKSTGLKFAPVIRPQEQLKDTSVPDYHSCLIYDYSGHNSFYLPLVMKKGEGAFLYDVSGKKYVDFLSAFSSVNQGHCHPKLRNVLLEQSLKLTQMTFICAHDQLGPISKWFCDTFKYDKIIFMNSGYEAVDTAIVMCRKWGYCQKKIEKGKAKILFPSGCYWGLMMGSRIGCDEAARRENFGPFPDKDILFDFVPFNDIAKLEEKFKSDPNIAAFVFEPLQGHAGNLYPDDDYCIKVRWLCTKYNVLMVADEVQVGLGRCGKLLAVDWEDAKPDVITLGKSLSGGFMPVSAVLANDKVMQVWDYGDHISTFSANPLGMAIAKRAVELLFEENLIENSEKLGKILNDELRSWNFKCIKNVQAGKGLFASIQVKDDECAWAIVRYVLDHGVITRPEVNQRIKIMPPLCIKEDELRGALKVLKEALELYENKGISGITSANP